MYRGISFRTLPLQLLRKNAESNTRGGVEYGFTSCSVLKEEAEAYAQVHEAHTHAPPMGP